MVIGWLAVLLGALVGALSLPAWVPLIIRVLLLYLAAVSVLILANAGIEHWLKGRRRRPPTFAFLDRFEEWVPTIRKWVVIIVLAAMGIGYPFVSSHLAALISGAPPQLKFYCGQKDITGAGGEIETLWIPSNNVAVPGVWVVNVGNGNAVNVEGRSDVKEDLAQLPLSGDKEYPHGVSWQIPLLRPNDPKITSSGSSFMQTPAKSISVRMVARYNGPTANADFTVRLVPIQGPSYPPNYLPCARPKLS